MILKLLIGNIRMGLFCRIDDKNKHVKQRAKSRWNITIDDAFLKSACRMVRRGDGIHVGKNIFWIKLKFKWYLVAYDSDMDRISTFLVPHTKDITKLCKKATGGVKREEIDALEEISKNAHGT